ncbi:MAG TPA: rhodanese-like domain-containing protein [Candidatus Eisenbacteria bacterium]|nr:rhodanese-like domain-containing protein [Candidatus Eisenbacteria bacterium]
MILAAGVGLGLGYNALSPEPLPWVAKAKPLATLDSLALEDTTTTSSSTRPEIIELQRPDTARSSVEDQHITNETIPPPLGHVDSAISTSRSKAETTVATDTFSAGPETPVPPTTPAPTSSYSGIPESEEPVRITLSQAKRLHDRGDVLILDARDPAEYAEGHIQGAASAPTDEKVGDIGWLEQTAKDPRPIIVYCGGGDCTLSIELANELLRTGHRRVLVFEEGFPAWQGAGYPVQDGSAP